MLRTDPDNPETGGAGTALVPLTPTLDYRRRPVTTPRPDPSFIAQLIANAEQLPQASRLRRASPADAKLAYRSQGPLQTVGARTRQVA